MGTCGLANHLYLQDLARQSLEDDVRDLHYHFWRSPLSYRPRLGTLLPKWQSSFGRSTVPLRISALLTFNPTRVFLTRSYVLLVAGVSGRGFEMQNLLKDRINRRPGAFVRRLEGIRRLGIAVATYYDWSNPNSPRFNPNLPKLIRYGQGVAGFIEGDLDEFIESHREMT